MASLRKRRGKWYIRIRFNGKEKCIPTHTSIKRDAEIQLKQFQLNETQVKLGLQESLVYERITLNDCIQYFEVNYPAEKGIQSSTMDSYRLGLKDLADCFSYIRKYSELNEQQFPALVAYLTSRYNPTTVNIRLRGIRTFFNYIVSKGYIKELPFKVTQIKMDKPLPKFIKPEELENIYKLVPPDTLLPIFRTFEATGMRLAELSNSTREGGFIIVKKTKGRKERIIPIPADRIADYDTARELNYGRHYISHKFTYYAKLAGIEGKTLHSLRHTFALNTLLKCNNIQLVKEALGHSTVSMTEVYLRFPTDYLKQVFSNQQENQNATFELAGKA
jgi:site-specific recombinase XerD